MRYQSQSKKNLFSFPDEGTMSLVLIPFMDPSPAAIKSVPLSVQSREIGNGTVVGNARIEAGVMILTFRSILVW